MTALALGCQSAPLVNGQVRSSDAEYVRVLPRPAAPPLAITPGDKLAIEFTRSFIPANSSYALEEGDVVRVVVAARPDLSGSMRIDPDGFLRLPQAPALEARGKSLQELDELIQKNWSTVLSTGSKVSLSLVESNSRLEGFLELLLLSPEGPIRSVVVDHAGTISLPGIGSPSVAQMTPRAAEEALNEQLATYYPGLRVILNRTASSAASFLVFGEVEAPGRYSLGGEVGLMDALALAGGETNYADLHHVVVIERIDPWSNQEDIERIARVYDIRNALKNGDGLASVAIHPRDMIMVPRTGIGDINEWVDQYLTKNLPFNLSVGYRIE